jgi:hypothetical protein
VCVILEMLVSWTMSVLFIYVHEKFMMWMETRFAQSLYVSTT